MALPHAFDHRDPQMGVPVAAWRRNACQGGIGALLRRFAFRRDGHALHPLPLAAWGEAAVGQCR